MHVDLHFNKNWLILTDFNQNLIMSKSFRNGSQIITSDEYPFSISRVVSCAQTDIRTDAGLQVLLKRGTVLSWCMPGSSRDLVLHRFSPLPVCNFRNEWPTAVELPVLGSFFKWHAIEGRYWLSCWSTSYLVNLRNGAEIAALFFTRDGI